MHFKLYTKSMEFNLIENRVFKIKITKIIRTFLQLIIYDFLPVIFDTSNSIANWNKNFCLKIFSPVVSLYKIQHLFQLDPKC